MKLKVLLSGILCLSVLADLLACRPVTNEAAILRDMRRDVKTLKLKVGYPGRFLEVPDSIAARRVQKYVRRAVELRKVDGLWDAGMESVGYVEAR